MKHRTALAGLTALAVTAGLTAGVSAPASAAPPYDPDGTTSGAAWLSSQLVDGLLPGQFGGSDVGLTLDAGLSLIEVGGSQSTVSAIDAAAKEAVPDYVAYEYEFEGVQYSGEAAGSYAKAASFARAAGSDPTSYGGIDLVERLEALTREDGRIFDVFQDEPDYLYANTLSQSYAARALTEADSAEAAAATDFLLAQQCEAGFFRLSLSPQDAEDQSCDGAEPAARPNVDVTAIAVVNLVALDGGAEVDEAVADAAAWLVEQQTADGGLGSDDLIPTPNANSTGLAAWALGVAGEAEAAETSAVWLRNRQFVNTASCTPYAAADEGAIAYDDAAFDGGTVADNLGDQFRRVAAQALPGLGYVPDATSEVTSTSGFVRTGTTRTIQVSASPGDLVCVTGPGTRQLERVGTDGELRFGVRMPKGTGDRAYRVEDGDEVLGTVRFRVLGAKRLQVKAPARVERGRKVTLVATGLARGEKATFTVRGAKRTDVAGREGRAKVTLRLKGKPGRVKVLVTGELRDIRKGRTAFRLTR